MKVGKHTDQRDRTLCLARILYEETDEKHPMPMTEMIRRLEDRRVVPGGAAVEPLRASNRD